MPEYRFRFTDSEQIVLDHWLVRVNADRTRQHDEAGNILPPFTVHDMLSEQIKSWMRDYCDELQRSTNDIFQLCQSLTESQRNTLVNKMPEGCSKAWLQHRLSELA